MGPRPKNPEIIKLLKSLETMSEYLEERRKKLKAREEFVRSVWEDACIAAGLVSKTPQQK